MNPATRVFLVVLPLLAAVVAFWLLVLGPKRDEAKKLEKDADALSAQVSEQEEIAAGADAARTEFPVAYQRLVTLGKAAPSDDDTSSLLVQLDRISVASGVAFISLKTEEGAAAAPAAPAPEPETPANAAEESEQRVENAEAGSAPAAPAPATEASAALLPIGASVGPAGLPVMRYTLNFSGSFFQLADFIAGLDKLVTTRSDGDLGVHGRLITIDSFDLVPEEDETTDTRTDTLAATFTVTAYLTPPDEGLTGGAAPTGPAPATEPQTTATEPAASDSATASTATP